MARILVLHGPNLNLLGVREPTIYGTDTLDIINQRLMQQAITAGHELDAWQSNAEHLLIERVHAAKGEGVALIIVNPGALTHTSIALRDAFLGVAIPFIEVHLSNIFSRESFRHHSYLSDIAVAVISGLGGTAYRLAVEGAIDFLAK